MGTDLELYRVFCEVVKYKNITKTAESMYMSQSAITQSIQKLEKMLGGKVFYRNKNGVELTEEGKNLYEYIKDKEFRFTVYKNRGILSDDVFYYYSTGCFCNKFCVLREV